LQSLQYLFGSRQSEEKKHWNVMKWVLDIEGNYKAFSKKRQLKNNN
jgi:predicted NAD-dependent protein-ADP-ribosyltransferase YbiA (DUF1768 family)